MKEFDFKAALAGEPVRLRQGSKAYVVGKIPSNLTYEDNELIDYPLIGVVLDETGYLTDDKALWTINGNASEDGVLHDADIIGMWEEPEIRIEDLPKPFKPKLGEYYYRITSRSFYDTLDIREKEYTYPEYDDKTVNQGNAFRTREDAQKWLDFMKSMME